MYIPSPGDYNNRRGMVVRRILPSSKVVRKPQSKQYSLNPTTLGEHIRKRRIELNLLQRNTADTIDVTEESIANWESGRSHPQLRNYPAIIAFLGYYPFVHENETIAGKLLYFRNSNGYSYEGVGKLLNVHGSTARAWELKQSQPSQAMQELILSLSRSL
jgi:DNA-binding transcriptional regulator YiaG